MTTTEKKEIVAYLSGPRNYAEGVRLYERHGHNRMYKRRFALEDTEFSRALLTEELRKLAGLSDAEFRRLPRLAKSPRPKLNGMVAKTVILDNPKPTDAALIELADSLGVTVDELVSPEFQDRVLAMEENEQRVEELTDELETARRKYAEAPEPVRKMIRFREKYSFLNSPDCPDILKVLVNDMFAAYDVYKTAFAHLQVIPDQTIAEAATEAEKVVTAYLANREIWDELEHYRTTGQILGKAAKFREAEAVEDLAALSDLDLAKKLSSARVNQSKHSKAVKEAEAAGNDSAKAAAALERWTATRERIEAEIERRKKK
ncbi:hypothetical protein [uncultured Muribaculum sp.]|jgi:hypothetical protein|uniref:hypothetical protein n=1 Tax=uncultured Muribaculum sp. TaxID=1918613 RepID=UPI0025AFDA76|nr:hypothetical protein [uncultured Muribaculum sp.]